VGIDREDRGETETEGRREERTKRQTEKCER
jgi:hypothetical protein